MRKHFILLFFSVFVFNLFGFYAAYWAKKLLIKQEMQNNFATTERKEIIMFSFSFTEYSRLQKLDRGKEFILNGMMYDIRSRFIENNRVVIFAEVDKKETSLIEELNDWLTDKPGNKDASNQQWLAYMFGKYFYVNEKLILFPLPVICYSFHSHQSSLLDTILTEQSPPPNML